MFSYSYIYYTNFLFYFFLKFTILIYIYTYNMINSLLFKRIQYYLVVLNMILTERLNNTVYLFDSHTINQEKQRRKESMLTGFLN